ncbi:MAG: hypothetical protein ABSH49_08505 [Bryobacteraceae bacterium]
MEERLEQIENGWLDIQQALKAVIQVQTNTNQTITGLAESIGQYVGAAHARTRRLEDNLDALIRAITAEHSNGKSQR